MTTVIEIINENIVEAAVSVEEEIIIEVVDQPIVIEVMTVGAQGPPGVGSSGFVFNETPAGLVNGSNATFTTAYDFVAELLSVFINGLLQKIVTHYQTIGNNTITFNESPQTGDLILINYIKQ